MRKSHGTGTLCLSVLACVSFLLVNMSVILPLRRGVTRGCPVRAKSSTNPGGRGLGLGFQRGDLENSQTRLQPGPHGPLPTGGLCILTYDVEDLRQGLSRHELILEGPENALGGLVDWHVVVADIFCQGEGPAPLRVARWYFLEVTKVARILET